MIVAGFCFIICVLALCLRVGPRKQPLDNKEIRRVRSFADKMRREQALPYE